MYTNSLEVRVCGLMRSGNHAIIEWVMNQYSGHSVCFLNNLNHGNLDPYMNHAEAVLSGIPDETDIETLRKLNKFLLVYSYEDRLDAELPDSDFLTTVYDADFDSSRQSYLGSSERFVDLLIVRDPFNCIASRLKLMQVRGPKGGSTDLERIARNWKVLATKSLDWLENPAPDHIVVSYNRWANDQSYRMQLSRALMGTFNDTSMQKISKWAGGSSFDSEYTIGMALKSWKKLFDPRKWNRFGSVYAPTENACAAANESARPLEGISRRRVLP